MSIPEWTFKLEAAEFKRNYQPDLMISWLLNSPDAELMPDHVRKAGRPRKDTTQ
jgi:hypothetical protein